MHFEPAADDPFPVRAVIPGRKRGPVAGTPQARRGGDAVLEKYGLEFYSEIGRKGGEAVKRERGTAYYAEIGRRGGIATRDGQELGFYERIGRIGGSRKSKRSVK